MSLEAIVVRLSALVWSLVFAVSAAQAESIAFSTTPPDDSRVIALPIFGSAALTPAADAVNAETNGAVQRAIAAAPFSGAMGEHVSLYGVEPYNRVVLVGAGDDDLSLRDLHRLGATLAAALVETPQAAVLFDGARAATATPAARVALGFQLGSYRYTAQQTGMDPVTPKLTFVTAAADANQRAFDDELTHLGAAVIFARDLINAPGNVIYPQSFVDRVRAELRGVRNVRISTLTRSEMAELNMGALLGGLLSGKWSSL